MDGISRDDSLRLEASDHTPAEREKRAHREKFFDECIEAYAKASFPEILLQEEFGNTTLELELMEGAAHSLNRAYWAFRDRVLAPTVSVDGKKRINVFKILSGKELATAHDYVWTLNKLDLNEQQAKFEIFVNAHFGFYVACAFTQAWEHTDWLDNFAKRFNELVSLKDISPFSINPDYPSNLLSEHVTVIANSLTNTRSNAIHNATWWRIFSLYIHDCPPSGK